MSETLDRYVQQVARKEYFDAREAALKELIDSIHEMNPPKNTLFDFKSRSWIDGLTMTIKCASIVHINGEEINILIDISPLEFENHRLSNDSLNKIVSQVSEILAERILGKNIVELHKLANRY